MKISEIFPETKHPTVEESAISMMTVILGWNIDGYAIGLPYYFIREALKERFPDKKIHTKVLGWYQNRVADDGYYRGKYQEYYEAGVMLKRPQPRKAFWSYIAKYNVLYDKARILSGMDEALKRHKRRIASGEKV